MSKVWRRLISSLEMIGGVCGFIFVLSVPAFQGVQNGFLIIGPILLAIDAASLIAGIYLWKGTNFGRTASIVIQFIQLPKIFSPYLFFSFSFGFDFFPQIVAYGESSIAGIQFRVLADNQLFINMDPGYSGLGISIVSILFLFKLFNYSPELDAEMPTLLDIDPPTPDEYFTESADAKEKPCFF